MSVSSGPPRLSGENFSSRDYDGSGQSQKHFRSRSRSESIPFQRRRGSDWTDIANSFQRSPLSPPHGYRRPSMPHAVNAAVAADKYAGSNDATARSSTGSAPRHVPTVITHGFKKHSNPSHSHAHSHSNTRRSPKRANSFHVPSRSGSFSSGSPMNDYYYNHRRGSKEISPPPSSTSSTFSPSAASAPTPTSILKYASFVDGRDPRERTTSFSAPSSALSSQPPKAQLTSSTTKTTSIKLNTTNVETTVSPSFPNLASLTLTPSPSPPSPSTSLDLGRGQLWSLMVKSGIRNQCPYITREELLNQDDDDDEEVDGTSAEEIISYGVDAAFGDGDGEELMEIDMDDDDDDGSRTPTDGTDSSVVAGAFDEELMGTDFANQSSSFKQRHVSFGASTAVKNQNQPVYQPTLQRDGLEIVDVEPEVAWGNAGDGGDQDDDLDRDIDRAFDELGIKN
ncbi:hypothetical protein HDU76_005376 [Blyttiomyces sp. JEL0837]|nr:hypothetical protein HDU76_005376 [Blyttiomyces sp. JEL0837]